MLIEKFEIAETVRLISQVAVWFKNWILDCGELIFIFVMMIPTNILAWTQSLESLPLSENLCAGCTIERDYFLQIQTKFVGVIKATLVLDWKAGKESAQLNTLQLQLLWEQGYLLHIPDRLETKNQRQLCRLFFRIEYIVELKLLSLWVFSGLSCKQIIHP